MKDAQCRNSTAPISIDLRKLPEVAARVQRLANERKVSESEAVAILLKILIDKEARGGPVGLRFDGMTVFFALFAVVGMVAAVLYILFA
jgi:hypothetical protein